MIRRFVKTFAAFTIILLFIIASSFIYASLRGRRRRLIYFSKITSFFSKKMLTALGVSVNVKNYENLSGSDKNYLIVSNHLSYIDTLAISSVIPSIFIASVDEVRSKFLLGTLAEFGGSAFVERRSRAGLSKEIDVISDLLRQGFNVVLFPEGTTSNGDRVLSFKTPFLTPAIRSNIDILPICLRYLRINGDSVDSKNRDSVFYYGDMTFFKHFFRFLSLESVEIELIGLENITLDRNLSRKELAKLAFDSINLALSTTP